jgi:hypothetical protein
MMNGMDVDNEGAIKIKKLAIISAISKQYIMHIVLKIKLVTSKLRSSKH